MFLVVVENLPHEYRFYENNRESVENILSYFCLNNSHSEVLIFSEYTSALFGTFCGTCLSEVAQGGAVVALLLEHPFWLQPFTAIWKMVHKC